MFYVLLSRHQSNNTRMGLIPNGWCFGTPKSLLTSPSNEGDWSSLGTDILHLILGLLGPVDHLRFGCVCSSWRRARSSLRTSCRSHKKPHDQAPLLMPRNIVFSRNRRFLHPSDGRNYTFTLPELCVHFCTGSSGSWLIMSAVLENFCYLYNPFTITMLKLPHGNYIRSGHPAAFSAEPFSQEFAMLTIDTDSGNCYCVRSGEQEWSKHAYEKGNGIVTQAVAVGGKFYGLTSSGRLASIDLDRSPILVWGDETERVQFDRAREHTYLLESDGELLVAIARCRNQPDDTQAVRLLRLDVQSSTWINAADMMRGRVLFLGPQGSVCTVAGGRQGAGKVYTAGCESFGVFDLNTSSGHLLCSHAKSTAIWESSAVWISPGLLFRDRESSWRVNFCNVARFWLVFWLVIFGIIAVALLVLGTICGLIAAFKLIRHHK